MIQRTTLLVILAVLVLSGCHKTSITSSWLAPDVEPIAFERTLVVAIHPTETVRRVTENRLVDRIGIDRAVASYLMISQDEVQNLEAARERLEGQGFDGAVTLRVIGTDELLTYTPGMIYPTYYGNFWGYYGYGWPNVYQPGYLTSETIVSVETNVYALEEERLIWSGVSETLNPEDLVDTVDDIADAVHEELYRRGLVD